MLNFRNKRINRIPIVKSLIRDLIHTNSTHDRVGLE